jgi:hypothetical protein
MIYSFSSKDEKVANRSLYYTLDDVENKLTNCEKCNYTFFSIEVVVQLENGPIKSYILPLKTERENYYMVGNKINKVFICYLIYQKYGVEYDSENVVYSLNLLDNLVRMSTLNELDCILFGKEDYEIEHEGIEDSDNESDGDNDSMPDLEEIIENDTMVLHQEKINEFQEEIEKLKIEIQEIVEETEKESADEILDEILGEILHEKVEEPELDKMIENVGPLCLSDTSDTSESNESYEIVGPTEKKKRGRPRNPIKL